MISELFFFSKLMIFAGINGTKTFFSGKFDSMIKKESSYSNERKICGMMWVFDSSNSPERLSIAHKLGGKFTREEYHKMLKRMCVSGNCEEFEHTIIHTFLYGLGRSVKKYFILTITNIIEYNVKRKKNMTYSMFRISFPEEEDNNDIIIIDTIDGVSDDDYENLNIGYMLNDGKIWSCLDE